MKINLPIPTEHMDAVNLAEYLEILKTQGKIILFSHIPNETFTKNWGTRIRNKREGVRKGVPDYIIITDTKVLFVELKRRSSSQTSPDQIVWSEALCNKQTIATIAKGFDQAKAFIDQNLK